MFVEAAARSARTTGRRCPTRTGTRRTDTGLSCPTAGDRPGLAAAASVPRALPDDHRRRETCTPTGTTGEWNASTGSSGGWSDWTRRPVGVRRPQVELSITVVTDSGTLGPRRLGRRRRRSTAARRSTPTTSRAADGGWTDRPAAGGHPDPANGWTRAARSSSEGGVVATDDTVYTGFGFEGIERPSATGVHGARAQHLGVVKTTRGQEQPGAGSAARQLARATKQAEREAQGRGKRLKGTSRKGKRPACASAARVTRARPATAGCRLAPRQDVYGTKAFSDRRRQVRPGRP